MFEYLKWSRSKHQSKYNQRIQRLFKEMNEMRSGNLTLVAEVWMLLCTISIPHVEASISRVLATSTIHKRHWGLSFTEHKRTMARIKKGSLYLNHMKVTNPWENKN